MTGLLDKLRSIVPERRLTPIEAYMLSERQAIMFLHLSGITSGPAPSEIVTDLPFIRVAVRSLQQSSGASKWIKPRWVILLNADEALARRRFSLFHEMKHVIDDAYVNLAYGHRRQTSNRQQIERICDYFAACTLMPRPWIKAAYTSGIQDPADLAEVFGVSTQAMNVRLLQLGLIDPYMRCSGIDNAYLRSLPVSPANLAA